MIHQSIAHYQITAKLGQGGMGEVYRATDTKLDREVAIKVLPESFAQDRERLARFEQEAKTLAKMNHSNIASVFGFENTENKSALVLELVEGEDLSERLKRGPVSVEETIQICSQIAQALEAAHQKGVIHRDLKPANIKISKTGQVKVLDFGLARMIGQRQQESVTSVNQDASTLEEALTRPGAILGTAPYMSPEQAKGREVDERADVWAFGCILFECLTGKRCFNGKELTDVLAEILKDEPDWKAIRDDVPMPVQLLLRKCLTKDPARRLRDIRDAYIDLHLAEDLKADFRFGHDSVSAPVTAPDRFLKIKNGIIALLCFVIVALVYSGFFSVPSPQENPPVRRLSIRLGAGEELFSSNGSLKFSSDGLLMGYLCKSVDGTGSSRLLVRRLNETSSFELSQVKDPRDYCFSPDGKWIAYIRSKSSVIYKVPVLGGEPVPIQEVEGCNSLDWFEEQSILVASSSASDLSIIPTTGNDPPKSVLSDLPQEQRVGSARMIQPQGVIVFTLVERAGGTVQPSIMALKPGDSAPRFLLEGSSATFVPGAPNADSFLLVNQYGRLMAVRFDPGTLSIKGAPKNILGQVSGNVVLAPDGSLAYTSKVTDFRKRSLAWMNRDGEMREILPSANYNATQIERNGNRLVFSVIEEEDNSVSNAGIWVYDFEQENKIQLTQTPCSDNALLWGPESQRIIFSSAHENGVHQLYWMPAVLGGKVHSLQTQSDQSLFPLSWHPDGEHLLVSEPSFDPERKRWNSLVRVLTIQTDAKGDWKVVEEKDYLKTKPRENWGASFSPDGNWIAYTDSYLNKTGFVAVDSYPVPSGNPIIVSGDVVDAYNPRWSLSSPYLFYLSRVGLVSREHSIFSSVYHIADNFPEFERPSLWSETTIPRSQFIDPDPDGKRILIQSDNFKVDSIQFYENFTTDLRSQQDGL